MTVLVTQDLPGVTDADYAGLVSELGSKLAEAPGFISHAAGPVDGGWRVNELWNPRRLTARGTPVTSCRSCPRERLRPRWWCTRSRT